MKNQEAAGCSDPETDSPGIGSTTRLMVLMGSPSSTALLRRFALWKTRHSYVPLSVSVTFLSCRSIVPSFRFTRFLKAGCWYVGSICLSLNRRTYSSSRSDLLHSTARAVLSSGASHGRVATSPGLTMIFLSASDEATEQRHYRGTLVSRAEFERPDPRETLGLDQHHKLVDWTNLMLLAIDRKFFCHLSLSFSLNMF